MSLAGLVPFAIAALVSTRRIPALAMASVLLWEKAAHGANATQDFLVNFARYLAMGLV